MIRENKCIIIFREKNTLLSEICRRAGKETSDNMRDWRKRVNTLGFINTERTL